MKKDILNPVKTAALLTSYGLFVCVILFFLFFGKGLQILMPFIFAGIFFAVFLLCEKISFISKRPLLKAGITLFLIVIFGLII